MRLAERVKYRQPLKPAAGFAGTIGAPALFEFATLGAVMRSLLLFAGLMFVPVAARAESPNPFRFIPAEANLILRVENPRILVEAITQHELVREAQQLPFAREAMESPAFQRFLQLVRYYEKDLGLKWPELLDKLGGNGLTLAVKTPGDNAPLILCVDGVDEELTKRFVDLAVRITEQELARQESKEKVEKKTYRGIEGFKLGDLRVARIGSTLLISNKKEALKAAVDLNFNVGKSLKGAAGPSQAREGFAAKSHGVGLVQSRRSARPRTPKTRSPFPATTRCRPSPSAAGSMLSNGRSSWPRASTRRATTFISPCASPRGL